MPSNVTRKTWFRWPCAPPPPAATGGLLSDVEAALELTGNDYREMEEELDRASLALRAGWLAAAHRPADRTLKSPSAGESTRMASGQTVSFGYERDLDASSLEARGAAYAADAAVARAFVLFRSGQAALSALMLWATGRWAEDAPLSVHHAGAYFETAGLIDSWTKRALRRLDETSRDMADIVIAEPVWCDGSFGFAPPPRARRALLLDTTLAGPRYDPAHHLARASGQPGPIVVFHSGLKLDQAGLELANVGIVQLLDRHGSGAAERMADELRHLRGLTGTGLTLDEMSALSAPWFLDRAYGSAYTGTIFDNNRMLAAAIGQHSIRFAADCHPSLMGSNDDAPFCAIRLRDPSPDRYRQLLDDVTVGIEKRGLLAVHGGSFGFRGHRFELIEPEPGQGDTFLRVALGWRDGFSRQGLCDLFGELAQAGR